MRIKNLTLLLLTTCLFVACGPQGCQAPLAPGGAYQGDKVLYEADQAIATGHDILQDFVTWEANYRSTLAQFPEIRKMADTIYREGPQWFASAMALRNAYKANPTAEAKTNLQAAIDIIHTAITQASQYLTQNKASV